MGLTVTEDTPADMLAGNMELLVQLPSKLIDNEDYENDDEIYDDDDDDEEQRSSHRNHHRHHNNIHNHNNGGHLIHQRRNVVNGNPIRRVTVARSTPMMDLLVQVATSQKLSASSYTLEAIGEHGLVLTHHPNTPIGALDALQVKLLPKQGTFLPTKTRHVNQPFEQTFRLQVHLPRNQLYVSRVSSRMNLGKILDEVCREKNLDRNNYELCHPANIEETLDLSLSLHDYHLQEVTLCPKRRSLSSSLSTQDIMALQRQEERRRQDAKQSVFGFAFKKSKESSLSTDSLGERSVSPARSDGTGRSSSPQAPPTAPTRPQRKRRPAPKPPMPRMEPEADIKEEKINATKETERVKKNVNVNENENENHPDRIIVISHSRNSSDSSGYHEASVLSDNLDSNIRGVPETLPRRTKLQTPQRENNMRTLAESSQASKSLGNLAVVPRQRATIARGTSNSSISSAGLRKKKAAPAPPQPRPLSSAISTQALERIIDSEESFSSISEASTPKASSDLAVDLKRESIVNRTSLENDVKNCGAVIGKNEIEKIMKIDEKIERKKSIDVSTGLEISKLNNSSMDTDNSSTEITEIPIIPNVDIARERKRAIGVVDPPVPKPRRSLGQLENIAAYSPLKKQFIDQSMEVSAPTSEDLAHESMSNLNQEENIPRHSIELNNSYDQLPKPMQRYDKNEHSSNLLNTSQGDDIAEDFPVSKNLQDDKSIDLEVTKIPVKPRRKTLEKLDVVTGEKSTKIVPVTPEVPLRNKKQIVSLVNEKKTTNLQTTYTNDMKRSCAVISTIPKCDNFQVKENDFKISSNELPEYNFMTKAMIDSGLGSSFGAGKSIFRNENRNMKKADLTTNSNNSDITNDELDLENFEMFEQSSNPLKSSNLLRSHSELNNFEINTFEDNGRHLTSRSVDFTFALNPNLSRNISDLSTDSLYPDKHFQSHLNLTLNDKITGKNPKNLHPVTTKLPPFLTDNITWEKQELSSNEENITTVGKSDSKDEETTSSTVQPITKTEETTSDLLKKVSDTLSESLQSPGVRATDDEVGSGDSSFRINKAKQISEVEKNLQDTTNLTSNARNFHDNHQPPEINETKNSSTTTDTLQNQTTENFQLTSGATDWEYILPEPPTAFRDTNVIENRKVFTSVSSSKTDSITNDIAVSNAVLNSNEEPASRLNGIVKSKETEVSLTNGTIIHQQRSSNIRSENVGIRSRTTSTSSEIGSDLTIEKGRLSRTGIKSSIDLDSRRGSQASSTPSIAPVDNTLSNFVITTYTKPKDVDIFDEIEGRIRESEIITTGRKNSNANSGLSENFVESRKSSIASMVNKDHFQAPHLYDETKHSAVVIPLQKSTQPQEISKKIHNDIQQSEKTENLETYNDLNNTLSRSNVKISIATKPRPRGNSVNEKQRPNSVFVNIVDNDSSDSKQDDVKPLEEASRESVVPGNNQTFSQWRENILNKPENSTMEKHLQSVPVSRNIVPPMDVAQKKIDDSNESERAHSNTSEESRNPAAQQVVAPISNNVETPNQPTVQQTQTTSSTNEETRVKRYTYAGPPAINLGSWSDRSRTTRVQIKPDNDYKFEKSQTQIQENLSFRKEIDNRVVNKIPSVTNLTSVKHLHTVSINSNKELGIDYKENKTEPDVLAKTFITRTPAGGFRRPVSMSFEPSTETIIRFKKESDDGEERSRKLNEGMIRCDHISGKLQRKEFEKEENEIDTRPRNFKELKMAFAKDQNPNSITIPKFGTFGRKSDQDSTMKSTFVVRRDSNLSSNGDNENNMYNYRKENVTLQGVENSRINNHKSVTSIEEKRNFVVLPPTNTRNGVQAQDPVRKTSRVTLMPVVKGFKVSVPIEDNVGPSTFSQDQKRTVQNRVAIGDISNGNHVPMHNGTRKTVQVKGGEDFNNCVPKPPTMPVITGVTLKSTNHINSRPKSMPVEVDPRNQLLESIRNFGGQNQLRSATRKNCNVTGPRAVRS